MTPRPPHPQEDAPDKIVPRELFFHLVGTLARYDGYVILSKLDGMKLADRLLTESKDMVCSHSSSPAAAPTPENICDGCTAEDEMCGKLPSDCYNQYQENIKKAEQHDEQIRQEAAAKVRASVLDEVILEMVYSEKGFPSCVKEFSERITSLRSSQPEPPK